MLKIEALETLKAEAEAANLRIREVLAEAKEFRRRHLARLVVGGICIGASGLVAGGYWFVKRDPRSVEWLVTQYWRREFRRAEGYEERRKVYLGLPEPSESNFSAMEDAILEQVVALWSAAENTRAQAGGRGAAAAAPAAEAGHVHAIQESVGAVSLLWARTVAEALHTLEQSSLLTTRSDLRAQLLDEVVAAADPAAAGHEGSTAAARVAAEQEARRGPALVMGLSEQLGELRQLLPASIERDVMSTRLLATHLRTQRWLRAEVLEANPPSHYALGATSAGGGAAHTCEASTRLLRTAVAFFPGPINNLVLVLTAAPDDPGADAALEALATSLFEPAAATPLSDAAGGAVVAGDGTSSDMAAQDVGLASAALRQLRGVYRGLGGTLGPEVQEWVLHSALTTTVSLLPKLSRAQAAAPLALAKPERTQAREGAAGLPSAGFPSTPYELYTHAIDHDLLGPLRRDARIPEQVLQQVKCVFLALPADLQARVLLTAVRHPAARPDADADSQAEIVRDLLSAGGVVAVKRWPTTPPDLGSETRF